MTRTKKRGPLPYEPSLVIPRVPKPLAPAPCSAVEELREGFRQLQMRAAETGDEIAAVCAGVHHQAADRLVVSLGGASVISQNSDYPTPDRAPETPDPVSGSESSGEGEG